MIHISAGGPVERGGRAIRARPLTGYWSWCRTTETRYPWLAAVRESEADAEQGVVPTLPDGWRPPTWGDLANPRPAPAPKRPPLTPSERTMAYHARLRERGLCRLCRGEIEPERCGAVLCGGCTGVEGRRERETARRLATGGLCAKCGKLEATPRRRKCRPCLDAAAASVRRMRRSPARLCEVCGERPRSRWRGLCRRCCLAAQVAARAEGREPAPCDT